MAAQVEVVVAETWLYEKLDAVFPIPIYTNEGPPDAEYPFVLFAYLDGSDIFGVGPARYLTGLDYKVCMADRTESWNDLLAGAGTIDTALHGQTGAPSTGGMVLSCVRTEPFVQRELLDGVMYASLGGVYHIQVQG